MQNIMYVSRAGLKLQQGIICYANGINYYKGINYYTEICSPI